MKPFQSSLAQVLNMILKMVVRGVVQSWLYGLDSICSVDWFHMLAQTLQTTISEVSPEDMWDPILLRFTAAV